MMGKIQPPGACLPPWEWDWASGHPDIQSCQDSLIAVCFLLFSVLTSFCIESCMINKLYISSIDRYLIPGTFYRDPPIWTQNHFCVKLFQLEAYLTWLHSKPYKKVENPTCYAFLPSPAFNWCLNRHPISGHLNWSPTWKFKMSKSRFPRLLVPADT